MKHTLAVTMFLVLIFTASQLVGLLVINEYVNISETVKEGRTVVDEETFGVSGITPPRMENETLAWVFIAVAVTVGTGIMLLLIRFRQARLLRLWMFLAISYAMYLSFSPFLLKLFSGYFGSLDNLAVFYIRVSGILLAVGLGVWRFWRSNPVIHNLTEIFIYPGIAVLVLSFANLAAIVIVLFIISVYDMIAVWQSKHMVKMAKYQTDEAKVFAGLQLEYGGKKDARAAAAKTASKKARAGPGGKKEGGRRSAILGGGDIAFPMLFSGALLKSYASFPVSIIAISTTAFALFLLLTFSKPGRFYPAMPFISAGCFAGWGLSWAIGLI